MNHLGGCDITGENGDHATYAPEVWDRLIIDYNAKTVLDVGCGAGYSLKHFIDRGLGGVGIEGWQTAIDASKVKRSIIKHDYINGPSSVEGRFDICWCCEFVEHVDERFVNNFIADFKKCRVLAMTHAVPGQHGHHHVNCQPSEYWVSLLSDNGFKLNMDRSVEYRGLVDWQRNGLHIRNTLLVFENQDV